MAGLSDYHWVHEVSFHNSACDMAVAEAAKDSPDILKM